MPRLKAAPFGNRIVATSMVPAGQLLGHPSNPYIHTHEQETVLTAMLQEIGFVAHVVVNRRSDKSWSRGERGVETIIDGHLRVQIALTRGEETLVPVAYVDCTADEELALLVSINPIAAMVGTDREKLDALAAELPDDLRELTAVLRMEKKAAKKLVAFSAEEHYRVVVECGSAERRDVLVARLQGEGFDCRAE